MASGHREPEVARRAGARRARLEDALRERLLPGEEVVAWRGAVMVTERRVLFAWSSRFGFRADAVSFEELTGWALGRRHDGRPLLRLEHPTHARLERVAAHRLLGFAWGNAEAEVPHDDVVLPFGGDRDPAFRALLERLERTRAPRAADFVVKPRGSRAERTARSRAFLSSGGSG